MTRPLQWVEWVDRCFIGAGGRKLLWIIQNLDKQCTPHDECTVKAGQICSKKFIPYPLRSIAVGPNVIVNHDPSARRNKIGPGKHIRVGTGVTVVSIDVQDGNAPGVTRITEGCRAHYRVLAV